MLPLLRVVLCSDMNNTSVLCSGLCIKCTAVKVHNLHSQSHMAGLALCISQSCPLFIQCGKCSNVRSVCVSRSKPASPNPWTLRQLKGPMPAVHTGMAAASLGHLAAMPWPASQQAATCTDWEARWSSLLQLTAVASLMLPQSAVNLTSRPLHLQV